jgi:hypothetical protein
VTDATCNIVCEICLLLRERDPKHELLEARHIVVIPADDEYEWAGMACCDSHYQLHCRVKHGQPLSGLSGGIQ